MKKLFIILIGATVISSCGANQETVDNMAQEMCDALDGIDLEDPSGLMDAAMAMMDVASNEDAYSAVSEAQLESAMKEKCPDGWSTFEELSSME